MLTGKWFEETKTGDAFSASLTVTETHLVLAAGLLGDFNPLHVDETYARGTRMGGRVLHGTFTSAIVSAPAGMYFHGTAIAYLEHNCRFKAPVRPGDTLRTTWTIEGREEKPKHGGGIVSMRARCENQRGELVAEADGKMLVASRPRPSRAARSVSARRDPTGPPPASPRAGFRRRDRSTAPR